MTNQFCKHNTGLIPQVHKSYDSQCLKRTLLAHSIHKLITLAGLTLVSSVTWADVHINPNEIWLEPGELIGICAHDMDQDGDIDLFKIHTLGVSMLENTGTPESPEFASSVAFSNDTGVLNLNRLGLSDCRYYPRLSPVSVDIDADGDLDLFTSSSQKIDNEYVDKLEYARNDGSTEHPRYISGNPRLDDDGSLDFSETPQELFGLPDNGSGFMFKDLDQDGDMDLFLNWYPTILYENTGTPEQATFVQRDNNPLLAFCDNGFPVDLNNDGRWDLLCRNFENNTFEYVESSMEAYLPKQTLFIADVSRKYINIPQTQAFDIDKDGDTDIIGVNKDMFILYTNIGSHLVPAFDKGKVYATSTDDFPVRNQYLSDLDGDGDLDAIGYTNLQPPTDIVSSVTQSSLLSYAINTGSNANPVYKVSVTSAELRQCYNSFIKIAGSKEADQNGFKGFQIANNSLVDIDGDSDLDLFSQLILINSENDDFYIPNSKKVTVYCENQGNSKNPLFTTGVVNPFGLTATQYLQFADSQYFGDIDGDGDQDLLKNNYLYENIGSSKQALFEQTSYFPFFDDYISPWFDMDGDGRIDSILDGQRQNALRILYNSLEPAINITATPIHGSFTFATTRPSQVQLQVCDPMDHYGCYSTMILAETPRELSLITGNFSVDKPWSREVVLAMIDAEGKLKIQIYKDSYNQGFQLIGSATGGPADSVSVSAGQLDDDPEDEYVVSFVQPNGRVAAIAYNLDGSRVGKAVAKQGTNPSVSVGKFDDKDGGYVLAYINADKRFETATFHGDGTLIAQGGGGIAHQISVHAIDLIPTLPGDEYVTASVQANGTGALIGFAADGTRLGKVVGGVIQQPNVKSGSLVTCQSPPYTTLAVSLIQSDQKPAIVFLDTLGNYLSAGIGKKQATVASLAIYSDADAGCDFGKVRHMGALTYIDKTGIVRWEIFSAPR